MRLCLSMIFGKKLIQIFQGCKHYSPVIGRAFPWQLWILHNGLKRFYFEYFQKSRKSTPLRNKYLLEKPV